MIVVRLLWAIGAGFSRASMGAWRAGHVASDGLGWVADRVTGAGNRIAEDLEALERILEQRPGGVALRSGWLANRRVWAPVRVCRAWRWRGAAVRRARRRRSPPPFPA